MIKAAVMGIAAAMLALYMKSVRPEYSSMISISAGIFILCGNQKHGGLERRILVGR